MPLSKLIFISILLVHHQINGGKVTKCFSCSGESCVNELNIEYCANSEKVEYSCMLQEGDVQLRKCVSEVDTIAIETCTTEDSCILCSSDLCNTRGDVTTLKKCYSCVGNCQPPYQEQNCPESEDLGNICSSTTVIDENGVKIEVKQCTPYVEDVIQNCLETNELPHSACYVCSEDLCNYNSDVIDNDNGGNASTAIFSSYLLIYILISCLTVYK